jgi:P27 family predicted phage terminase small subunit
MPGVKGRSGGRNRKPAAVKLAEGNRGKRRIHPDLNAEGKPECPEYFTADQRLRWHRLIVVLPRKLLAAADGAIIERFIVSWQRFRDCEVMLQKTGMLVHTPTGPKRNPLLGIQLHCDRVMAGAGIELGLSPVARARLARPEHETDQDDVFEAYIFGDTDYIN